MLILSSKKYAFRHKKASAGGGSFAGQVVLNNQICGPFKTNPWSYINNGLNCATCTMITKEHQNHVINRFDKICFTIWIHRFDGDLLNLSTHIKHMARIV